MGLARSAETLCWITLASLACTLPAAARVSGGARSQELFRSWAALGAVALVPLGLAIVLLRGAREGLRGLLGRAPMLRLYAAGAWGVLFLVAVTLLGNFLRATTHNSALAGVAFALTAVAVATILGLSCARLVEALEGMAPLARRATASALALLLAILLARMGHQWAALRPRAGRFTSGSVSAVDGTAFVLAAFAIAPVCARGRSRALSVMGPASALAILVLGFSVLRSPTLRSAISTRAPVFAPIADLVSGQ